MKFSSKCATALVALMAVSTVGGTFAFADEATEARTLVGEGKVTVGEAEDTEKDKDKDKSEDPEEKDDKGNPDETTVNPKKGPIKIERLSLLDFDKIETSSQKITQYAKPTLFTKDNQGNEIKPAKERGALVQFADVRSDVYGYTITAAMTQQFTNGAKKLDASEITFNNAMIKAGTGNENLAPSTVTPSFTLKEDAEAKTVLVADKAKEEGKGRYVLEYGQSDSYNEATEGAGKGGTAGTAKTAVALDIPGKTAANMAKGNYAAKITWNVVVAP